MPTLGATSPHTPGPFAGGALPTTYRQAACQSVSQRQEYSAPNAHIVPGLYPTTSPPTPLAPPTSWSTER